MPVKPNDVLENTIIAMIIPQVKFLNIKICGLSSIITMSQLLAKLQRNGLSMQQSQVLNNNVSKA